VVAAAEAVNIHDYLNVCIGDGGGPARSSSIRTFVDSLGNTPETYHRRFANNRNTTTVRLKSNPTTPTPADCIACTTSNGDIEERGQNFKI
jgi:hypothetical protein